jgi:hypothetical protein
MIDNADIIKDTAAIRVLQSVKELMHEVFKNLLPTLLYLAFTLTRSYKLPAKEHEQETGSQ